MKEQVIASRGARRAQPKGFAQRPVRRDGSAAGWSFSPRAFLAYVPKALKVVLAILILIAAIVGYRVAGSASLFQVRAIDVTGTTRTSADEIAGLTRRSVIRSGVWRADLPAISNELSKLPGVRRAVVGRVLPDGLRVRVIERTPVAVVRNSAGRFVWVDDEGYSLGETKPDDQMPAFFIRGWSEDGTEESRAANAERVKKYLELTREWSALGLSERVSEVTLVDLQDVRAQLAGNDSQVEVRLGSQDQGTRLKIALGALDMYKQTPRGSLITYVNVQTGRVTIGSSSGKPITDLPANESQIGNVKAESVADENAGAKNKPSRQTSTNEPSKPAKKNEGARDSRTQSMLRFR